MATDGSVARPHGMTYITRGPALTATITLAVLLGSAAPAWPCLNGVMLSTDEAGALLRRAEKALAAGKHRDVLRWLGDDELEFPGAMQGRVNLVLSVAQVRMGAADEALDTLQYLHEAAPDDPEITARLAEAHAALPDGIEDARPMIEELAAKDLIPDGHGHVTLAVVRRDAGDVRGSNAALARCRVVAKKAERKRVCRLPSVKRAADLESRD